MPFLGVVHANARKVIGNAVPAFPQRCHVLCSGNFSIEATLRLNGYEGFLTGSDVSLYTCALGLYFSGHDMILEMNVAAFPEMEPLAQYMTDACGKAAVVSLALDALPFYERKNPYARRMWRHYSNSWEQKVEKTRVRLEERKAVLRLDEFHPKDAWERAGEIPPGHDDMALTFPPTYEGGYEKLYKALEGLFVWNAPSYQILTTGEQFAQRLIERDGPWLYGTEKRTPELDELLGQPFADAPRDTQVKISLYSDLDLGAMVLRREVGTEEPPWPRLTDHDEIGPQSKLTVHRVKSTQANYIRQVYASVEIGQASAAYSYAVAVDGKVIGILLFQEPTFGMKLEGEDRRDTSMYMMADIAVSSVKYPKLSKLLLAASLSKELRHDLESRTIRSLEYNVSTAFSTNPVSMKYRGMFKLHTRKQEPSGVYVLNYFGHMGQWTLKAALKLWRAKHVGDEHLRE